MFTKRTVTRVIVYLSGLCILALGLTISTKADLGVSPIIAVSFCISKITGARFGDMTFLLYASFVAIEILLHLIPGKRRPEDRKKAVIADVLQLPLSYFFTMLLNALSAWIPSAETMVSRIAVLLLFLGRIVFLFSCQLAVVIAVNIYIKISSRVHYFVV